MAELDVSQVVCWCKSLAPAVGSDMAKKIGEYVARRRLDGDHLAEVLRLPQDFISDAQIDGLTMIPANKGTFQGFLLTSRAFAIAADVGLSGCCIRDESRAMSLFAFYDEHRATKLTIQAEACKTVAQQAPRRQEAPVPPPPSRAPPLPRSRRDSTNTGPGSGHSVEQFTGCEGRLEAPDFVPTASSTGGGPQHNLTAMLWMQAVIDRLASTDLLLAMILLGRANLDRRTAYREIEDLLPEWMWNHLWGAVETSGTKRDSGSSSDGNTSPKEALVGLEILRAALAGTGIPTCVVRREPGRSRERTARNSLAKAPSSRNIRRSSVVKEPKKRPAMIDTKSSPTCRPSIGGDKNPEQLAEWIRTLPSTQIPSPKLSELADTIVSNGIDGAQMSSSGGLRDLGICNPLESRKLDRFWRNVLAETRAAECARDNAGQIRTGGVQVAL
ncbi:hypothetical protein FOL46_006363 [Perkinsus olseni]|uniref:Uncharacterized protein n=1 Tax=Perkinsus olseni TaxID=32597 RepID=A0A7J6LLQ3_PEROL|nr:hypothetical protein FOL46_006363 [Perkinsus olseni]